MGAPFVSTEEPMEDKKLVRRLKCGEAEPLKLSGPLQRNVTPSPEIDRYLTFMLENAEEKQQAPWLCCVDTSKFRSWQVLRWLRIEDSIVMVIKYIFVVQDRCTGFFHHRPSLIQHFITFFVSFSKSHQFHFSLSHLHHAAHHFPRRRCHLG